MACHPKRSRIVRSSAVETSIKETKPIFHPERSRRVLTNKEKEQISANTPLPIALMTPIRQYQVPQHHLALNNAEGQNLVPPQLEYPLR